MKLKFVLNCNTWVKLLEYIVSLYTYKGVRHRRLVAPSGQKCKTHFVEGQVKKLCEIYTVTVPQVLPRLLCVIISISYFEISHFASCVLLYLSIVSIFLYSKAVVLLLR